MSLPNFEVNFKPVANRREGSKFLGNAEIVVPLSSTVSVTIRRCAVFDGSNGMFMKWPNQQYEKDGQTKSFSFIRVSEPDQPQQPPYKGAFELAIEEAVRAAVNGSSSQTSDGSSDGGGSGRGGRGGRGGRSRPAPRQAGQRASTSVDDEW
jgi:hypothetical protein